MTSTVKKRSIILGGHKTSISLEDSFWTGLKHIAYARRTTVSEVIGSLDAGRENGNLSSAIRVFILDHYRAMVLDSPRRAILECVNATKLPNENYPTNAKAVT